MDKSKLIERLKRIFPNLEMYSQPELFNDETDCTPGYDVSWCEIIEELEENGLEIVNKEPKEEEIITSYMKKTKPFYKSRKNKLKM